MRQIGTVSDEAQAVTLAEYLLSLRIETRLEREPAGWAVWVIDEDRLAQARQELDAFLHNPADPRYADASAALRRRVAGPADAARRPEPAPAEPEPPPAERSRRPWTFAVLAACLTVGLATNLGDEKDRRRPLLPALRLTESDSPGLPEVARGEVWRLVTPAFIHLDFLHLLVNLLFFFQVGGLVEERRGPWRFLALLLVTAIVSNLTQFYLGHPTWEPGVGLRLWTSGNFGGLSGVLYGLFGYAWVKGRLEPDLDLDVNPAVALLLMLWFFLCFTPAVPNIANGAHAGGLVTGAAVAAAPPLWRSLWGREGSRDS
jgi:GlpG protein